MSRATDWPVVLMVGFSLLAPLWVGAFVGCETASNEQAAANQFRPVDESANKTKATSGEKEKPVASEKTTGAETAPIAQNPAAKTDSNPPDEKAALKSGKEIKGPYAAKLIELRKLGNVKPRGATREQQLESLINATRARLALAKELASDPEAPEDVHNEALFTSMKCYGMLMDADEPDARENFAGVARQLSEAKDPKIAAVGKAQLFSLKMIEIFAQKPQDGKQIVDSIANLLESLGQEEVGFDATVRVVQVMEQMEMHDDATRAMQLIGNHYAASKNPQIAMQAQGLQVSMILMQLRRADAEKAPDLNAKLVAKLEQLAQSSENDEDISSMITQVAHMLEGVRDGSSALPLYELALKVYGGNKDEKIVERVKTSAENGKKRLGLLGKDFQVSGVVSDGSKFDWSDYKGKVVLVDFWATWCRPCLEEMSNIRKYYDLYHGQGFEVVGVNLDEDPQELQAFFDKQTLAWNSVVSPNAQELGFKNPLVATCGVDSIPFVVLIGRDGKVLGIHVRGERLGEELAKLFDAPAKKTEAAETETPQTDAPKSEEPTAEVKK